jgi:hypothetical protein
VDRASLACGAGRLPTVAQRVGSAIRARDTIGVGPIATTVQARGAAVNRDIEK